MKLPRFFPLCAVTGLVVPGLLVPGLLVPGLLACVLTAGTAAHCAAQSAANNSDSREALAAITDRGRQLYAYDQAAWHGTDAVFELHPDMQNAAHYICMPTSAGWRVLFPRWNAVHDHLMIAYEATETGPGEYKARKIDPPQEAGDDLLGKERALELALSDFKPSRRAYNTALLHAPGGNLYVYLYPGQTKDTVWPLGGDVRYTISPDGTKIVEKRELHNTILELEFDPGKKPVSGFHTHVLSDVPEDTDVLYVLNRRPLMPEYIGTMGGWFFVIATDGTITSMQPCANDNPLPCGDKRKKK